MFKVFTLLAVPAWGLLAGLATGCERPPVGGGTVGVGAERVVVDLSTFLQDRPAIGGKWYDYGVDGHILEPKPQAWIVKSEVVGSAIHAFKISSIYDDDTGETGVFTLQVVTRGNTGWSEPQTFVAPANVKDGAPVCVDLSILSGVACTDVGWHLRFTLQNRLSVFAGFAVAEPAVFLADGVVAARVDGLSSLAALPDPATLQDLDDEPVFATTDWDFSRYATDLPVAGRTLGSLPRAIDGAWAFVDVNFAFVRFAVVEVDSSTLRFSVQRQPIEREDFSRPRDLGAVSDVDVDIGTLPLFISFAAPDLLTPATDMVGSNWPLQPPFAKRYDLVVDDIDGVVQLLLSPAAAALHLDP